MKPSVTPAMRFATSVRDMPHIARAFGVSSRMAISMLAFVELGNDVVDEHMLELALGALDLDLLAVHRGGNTAGDRHGFLADARHELERLR